jgi:hypothetical protein
MILQPVTGAGGTGAAAQKIQATCQATDTVGDAVYVSGNKVAGRYPVTKVDVDDIGKMPAVGVIVEKYAATECAVQIGGVVADIYTGLTPNAVLFIGTDSRLTETRPARPGSGSRLLQTIAQALSTTEFQLRSQDPTVLVAA